MKGHQKIWAGTALALLMACVPLASTEAAVLNLPPVRDAARAPIMLAQDQSGEEGQPSEEELPKQRRQKKSQEQAPAEAPAEKPARDAEPQPDVAPAPEPAQPPVEEPAPKPRKKAPAEPAPEQPAPEQPPAEEPAAREAPAEQPPVKEQPAERAPAEEPPAKAEPAPEQPAEETPRQKPEAKPEKQAPAEPAPAEPPAEQPAPEQAPAETPPAPEAPARDQQPADQAPPEAEQPAAPAEQPADQVAPEQPRSDGAQPAEPAPAEPAPAEPAPAEPAPAERAPAPAEPAPAQPEAPAAEQPAEQSGQAPARQKEAPVLDSQKERLPADDTAADGQSGQTGEQPPAQAEPVQPAQPADQATQQPAPAAPAGPPPADDSAAQQQLAPVEVAPVTAEEGKRVEREPDILRQERPQGADVLREIGDRVIIQLNNQVIVESNDRPRMSRGARETYYEDLPRGRTRETIVRENGVQVVTIRNRYGDIIRRSRITPDGREYILTYVDEERYDERGDWRDPGDDLPPMRLTIPVKDYILDAERVDDPEAYYEFLDQPPVEQVERLYSVDEVKRSARVRDKTRRVDLDTVTFEFGSASIVESEIPRLEGVAQAMERLLKENPAETFLIEGHTDAVGTELANLALSDRRAEAVADALTNVFGIPPENLTTQGYGEQYLKVRTQEPERENRRVAIRRITALVAPVASAN